VYFKYLRKTPWYPSFTWIETSIQAAHRINSFHEDYPKYVKATDIVLQAVARSGLRNMVTTSSLLLIHGFTFPDKLHSAGWRKVNVEVGLHLPPEYLRVPDLMGTLQDLYTIADVEDLIEWYKDFETIHPFQDGNGRVGGIIVAAYAHTLHPERGWLAAEQ